MRKVLLTMALLSNLLLGKEMKKPENIKIGITQLMEHGALDSAREGFIKALKENGYGKAKIDYQNSQGDIALAQLIGQKFVQEKKDIICAISTPSAQASLNATKEIPILFTAITDPVGAGLVGKNITGTTNYLPMKGQLDTITKVFPNAKKIGVLYNTSEQNSVVQMERAKKESKNYNLEIIEKAVTNINDIGTALDSMLPKVDLIYTITDSMVVSATPLVVDKATKQGKPVVACIESQITQGATLTTTLDYEKLGYQTGMMAVDILNGKDISKIKVEGIKETTIVVNRKMAKKYGIDISNPVLKNAKFYD